MFLPQRAHIIHIPGHSRRGRNVERLAAQLRSAGISSVTVFEGIRPNSSGGLRSIGELGCYLSHLACLRIIAAGSDDHRALVLEDDAVLSVPPSRLAALLTTDEPYDFLHAGHLSRTLFRDWDQHMVSQALLPVHGVLFGTQCYVASARGLQARCEQLESLLVEEPLDGGGVGIDGAFCELAWRDPTLIRLAPPRSLFHTLPGVGSTIRRMSLLERGQEITKATVRAAAGHRISNIGFDVAPHQRREPASLAAHLEALHDSPSPGIS